MEEPINKADQVERIEANEVQEVFFLKPKPTPTPTGLLRPVPHVPFIWKPYQAEVAPSNRAQCHETYCKCNIGKGSLRIGHYQGDNRFISWYHAPCAFRAVENRYLRNPPITSVDMIGGYEKLSDEHKLLLQSLMDGTYEEPAPIASSRPKRACVAAKEEAEKEKKNQTEEQQPKKRARKTSS